MFTTFLSLKSFNYISDSLNIVISIFSGCCLKTHFYFKKKILIDMVLWLILWNCLVVIVIHDLLKKIWLIQTFSILSSVHSDHLFNWNNVLFKASEPYFWGLALTFLVFEIQGLTFFRGIFGLVSLFFFKSRQHCFTAKRTRVFLDSGNLRSVHHFINYFHYIFKQAIDIILMDIIKEVPRLTQSQGFTVRLMVLTRISQNNHSKLTY